MGIHPLVTRPVGYLENILGQSPQSPKYEERSLKGSGVEYVELQQSRLKMAGVGSESEVRSRDNAYVIG